MINICLNYWKIWSIHDSSNIFWIINYYQKINLVSCPESQLVRPFCKELKISIHYTLNQLTNKKFMCMFLLYIA